MMTVTATATAMNSKYTFNLRHEALSKHTYTHSERGRDIKMSVLHAFRAIFLMFSFLDFFLCCIKKSKWFLEIHGTLCVFAASAKDHGNIFVDNFCFVYVYDFYFILTHLVYMHDLNCSNWFDWFVFFLLLSLKVIDFPGQMENFLHHYIIEGGITKSKAQPMT